MDVEKNPVATLIGAVAGIAAMIYVFQSLNSITNVDTTVPTPLTSESADAYIAQPGEEISDGQFTFTVGTVKCGISKLGEETTAEQFCVMPVHIQNSGAEPQMFSESDQFLIDDQGRKFSYDSAATIEANDGDWGLDNINPGLSQDMKIAFILPSGVIPVGAEMHDSFMSSGVATWVSVA